MEVCRLSDCRRQRPPASNICTRQLSGLLTLPQCFTGHTQYTVGLRVARFHKHNHRMSVGGSSTRRKHIQMDQPLLTHIPLPQSGTVYNNSQCRFGLLSTPECVTLDSLKGFNLCNQSWGHCKAVTPVGRNPTASLIQNHFVYTHRGWPSGREASWDSDKQIGRAHV